MAYATHCLKVCGYLCGGLVEPAYFVEEMETTRFGQCLAPDNDRYYGLHTLPLLVMVTLYAVLSPTEALLSPSSSTNRPVIVASTCAGSTPQLQEQFVELLATSSSGLSSRKQGERKWRACFEQAH